VVDLELALRETNGVNREHGRLGSVRILVSAGRGKEHKEAVLALARALERGAHAGPLASALGRVWQHTLGRAVVRRLTWPSHVRVVAVGGATLGGSGKTPLAMACAEELAAAGASGALVGHGYRADPGRARIVGRDDPIGQVGDEALLAARALGPAGVPVVVAPRRSEAVALAARIADVLVIDGIAQTTPARASLALLAVDAREPWGCAAALPPAGDLRAPRSRLLGACDMLVAVGDEPPHGLSGACHVRTEMPGARVAGDLIPWDSLARLRLGLLSALARPERVVRALERRGVRVCDVIRAADHGPFARDLRDLVSGRGVDLWLATPKCALHAFEARVVPSKVGVICTTYALPLALTAALRDLLDLAVTRQ
jgi:tetraacyldisaccharide 4'-kinase